MFPLSDSAKQAWQRYESGQGRFRFGYRVFFTESSSTTFTHYEIHDLVMTERAIQATDKKFPFPQCSFSCDAQIVTGYNIKGNFYLQGYLSEFAGYDDSGKPKWTAYWMSRTPWFRVDDVSRNVGGVAKYRYSAQARSKAEDERLFFGTQYPYTTTTDYKKTYNDIFKYYNYLDKTYSARTWGSGSEISALLNALPKEDYDYSGDGLQILFNHFRNSGYYLKLGYVPEYSPTSAQRVAYDVDFDLQAVSITDLSTVDTANLPQISLGDCSDIPKIDDRNFAFNLRTFSVQDSYASTLEYTFSPALDTALSSGVTYKEKRAKILQMVVKSESAMMSGQRDFFAVGDVGLFGGSVTAGQGHSYVPWSGNSKSILILPGTYSMTSTVSSANISGYCVDAYYQNTILEDTLSARNTNMVDVDTHTYDKDSVLLHFPTLLKKQYTISGVFPLMPFYEIYDIVKLYTPKGTRVAQIVKKKVSLDSASMELTFECQQNPESILPSVWG